jgi:hypothetical protein
MTALGRQEQWEDSPEGYPQTPPYEWWNWHDEYGDAELSQGWLAKVAEAAATTDQKPKIVTAEHGGDHEKTSHDRRN